MYKHNISKSHQVFITLKLFKRVPLLRERTGERVNGLSVNPIINGLKWDLRLSFFPLICPRTEYGTGFSQGRRTL